MRSPRARRRPRPQLNELERRDAPASLSGRVFLDYDNSGTFNGPDSGIAGVTVTLTGSASPGPQTTLTDANGTFSFSGLPTGTYSIATAPPAGRAILAGKVTTGTGGGHVAGPRTIDNIRLSFLQSQIDYSFAEIPLVSTGGTVYRDTNSNETPDPGEPGIPGVQVTLTGTSVLTGTSIVPLTVTTAANGNYSFVDLVPGVYTITETQPNGFTDGNEHDGAPNAATVTNDRFAGIDLTATSAPSGGFDFGEAPGQTISGVVFVDANNDGAQAPTGEPGIAGAQIRLTGVTAADHHTVSLTLVTASDGSFTFGGLKPGTYTLTEPQPTGYAAGKVTAGTLSGNTTVRGVVSAIDLGAGASAAGYLFGELAEPDLRISQSPSQTTSTTGASVTIAYTVRNRGTAPAPNSTLLLNDGGLLLRSASDPAQFDPVTKSWALGALAPGALVTIKVTYRVPASRTFGPGARAATAATELTTKNNSVSGVVDATVTPPPPNPFGFAGVDLGALAGAIAFPAQFVDMSWVAPPAVPSAVHQLVASIDQALAAIATALTPPSPAGLANLFANISAEFGNNLALWAGRP
jgi:protocatechuate 3,4-dioxygenase beta subunit